VDDPTREAVAKAAGVETDFGRTLGAGGCNDLQYGRKPAENQKRQAMVPKGALGVLNPLAPPVVYHGERTKCNHLITRRSNEMEYPSRVDCSLSAKKIRPARSHQGARASHVGSWRGTIDEKIGDLETLANPTVGWQRIPAWWIFALRQKRKSEGDANAMIADIESQI